MQQKGMGYNGINILSIIIVLLLFALVAFLTQSCEEIEPIFNPANDAEIKAIAFTNKLTNRGVYQVIGKPLLKEIHENDSVFNCSSLELRIAITAMVCLETGYMKSELVYSNNVLGIKTLKLRPSTTNYTLEEYKGKLKPEKARFAAFYSFEDCFHNFFTIMKTDRYKPVRDAGNVSDFLFQIQKCGYATDTKYFYKAYEKVERITD